MNKELDLRRILIYLAFAYGIAWTGGLVIALTGGLANSPQVVGPITLSILLLTVVYMGAPAIAHVLTRLVTREGWQDVWLRPHLRRGWPYWLIAWIGPALLTFAGMAVYFLLFPRYFDPALTAVQNILPPAAGEEAAVVMSPWLVVLTGAIQAVLLAPVLNSLPIFGEEFGWRAYLQPKLMVLGPRRAMLWMGVIWGVWHWPVIAMGHNYGLSYPGAPWTGMLAMVWFTFVVGTFIGWCSWRGGSVWPAVIAHGALNGIAGITVFFVQGEPNMVIGPSPAGLIGSAGFALVALGILWRPGRPAQEAPANSLPQ